jgi:hypothetical protein
MYTEMTNHLRKSNESRYNTERNKKGTRKGREKKSKNAESLNRKSSPHKVME